ncbi:MAG: aspartate aminotransferase family protein [bacterium]|nr:aspartate aminotransferase family protein [bacterium]
MRLWQTNPFHKMVLTRGEGSTVWDTTGKPYVDLLSGTWCNILGYGHPRWVNAIREQVAKLTHVGASFFAEEVDHALPKLQEILPPLLNRVVFLNTGSEAVELALKMARAATHADRVVVIEKGYYGATSYALTLSEAGRTAPYLPRLGSVHRLPVPHCRRCPAGRSRPCGDFACLDGLRALVEDGEPLAAVIYEPVMGAGGIIVCPDGYGTRLRDLTSRCGALLIAEEVTTGVGRTGRWFGFEHDDVVPDVLVIGKAIGAGLPVAVVATTEEVETRCGSVLRHVQSHQNDPLSARMAATVISILQEEGLIEAAAGQGACLMNGLRDLQSRCPSIAEVRGKGAMLGVELVEEQAARGPAMVERLLEAGFIVDYQPHNATFRFFPPYVVSTSEIDAFLSAFEQVLLV